MNVAEKHRSNGPDPVYFTPVVEVPFDGLRVVSFVEPVLDPPIGCGEADRLSFRRADFHVSRNKLSLSSFRTVPFSANRRPGFRLLKTSDSERRTALQRASAAFTLIEVLLALALFAIAVVVLSASYINVLFALQSVRADRVLEQEMTFVRSVILTAPDLDTIEEGGELPTGAMGYAYWEAELEPTQIADLFVVHVSVVLQGTKDEEERSLTERLIVLRPSWSEPVDREELRAESMQRLEDMRRNRPL